MDKIDIVLLAVTAIFAVVKAIIEKEEQQNIYVETE